MLYTVYFSQTPYYILPMPHIASIDDAIEILQLQKLAYQSEAAIYNDYTIAPLTQTPEGMIADLQKQVVLKETLDGRIVGSVRGYVREDTGYIGRLIVHPDYRNHGIGAGLMSAIEQSLGVVKRFELFTGHRSERNIRLYERLGYKTYRTESVNDRLTIIYMEKSVE